ncbi:hypothetical protein [Rubritalea tangerina]
MHTSNSTYKTKKPQLTKVSCGSELSMQFNLILTRRASTCTKLARH